MRSSRELPQPSCFVTALYHDEPLERPPPCQEAWPLIRLTILLDPGGVLNRLGSDLILVRPCGRGRRGCCGVAQRRWNWAQLNNWGVWRRQTIPRSILV